MRAMTGSNTAVQGRDFKTYGLLTVDDVPVKDVLGWNPLVKASWDHDIDNPIGSGQISVDLQGPQGPHLSPWMSTAVTMDGRPLFDVGRYLSVWTATCALDALPQAIDWHRVFDSRIDDYDPASNAQQDLLVINCRDSTCDALDTWTEDKLVDFGDANVDVVIQAFLTTSLATVLFTVDPTPGPSFFVRAKTYDQAPALLNCRQLALLSGWDLRGKFNAGSLGLDDWGLVLQDVRRSVTTPSYSFPRWRYFTPSRMLNSRNTVRNRIKVITAPPDRTPIFVTDDDSVNLYGRRFAELDEGLTSHIDTADEGLALANYALSDLKDPKAEWVVPMPYWYAAEIHDRYEFQPEVSPIHFDQPTTLAVSGFRQTLDNGEATTELRLRKNAAAANREWRSRRDKDIYVATTGPAGSAREGALWIPVAAA